MPAKRLFPKLGLRNFKTAIAATLCAFAYALIDRNPTFACIGAVFAMNTDLHSSWETGGNRLWGTMIGGFTGMLFFYLYNKSPMIFPNSEALSELVFLFFGIMVMILISQFFHVNGAIPSGSVVFYIVMLNTPENQYVSYAINRMIDTGIGVIISIFVNILLPRELFSHLSSHKSLTDRLESLEKERELLLRDIESLEKLENRRYELDSL